MKEGFVKILTRAKTILVPPIEPGRRHHVWRRGPSLKVFVSRIKFNPTKNKKGKPGKSGREEELKKTDCCDCHPISAGFQLNSSSFLSSWIRWTKGKRFTVHCHWSFKEFWLQRFCLHWSELWLTSAMPHHPEGQGLTGLRDRFQKRTTAIPFGTRWY